MSDKAKPEPTPVIWVFGGGITGLTVAHECIERGYDVYLVEPSEDSWEAHLPAVGGVARTQWAMRSQRPRSTDRPKTHEARRPMQPTR